MYITKDLAWSDHLKSLSVGNPNRKLQWAELYLNDSVLGLDNDFALVCDFDEVLKYFGSIRGLE